MTLPKPVTAPELFSDPRHVPGPKLVDVDVSHPGGGESAPCFFLAPLAQMGGAVAEGFVLCKLCLPGRDELIPLLDIVDAVKGVTSPSMKKG